MFILLCFLFLSTTFNTTIFAAPEETAQTNQTSEIADLNAKLADIEEKLSNLKDLENKSNFELTPEKITNLHLQAKNLLQKNLPVPLYKKVYTSIKNFASSIKSYVTVGNTFRALILSAELYAAYYFLLKPQTPDSQNITSTIPQHTQTYPKSDIPQKTNSEWSLFLQPSILMLLTFGKIALNTRPKTLDCG